MHTQQSYLTTNHTQFIPTDIIGYSDTPSPTLTTFFTDIEGSVSLWDRHREAMLPALLLHNAILEQVIHQHNGRILEWRGDGIKAVFEQGQPLHCALALQRHLARAQWGPIGELRIRIGMHTVFSTQEGHEFFKYNGQYFGPALNHGARIMDFGQGGQIVVSADVVRTYPLPPGATWVHLGAHALKGFSETHHLYRLTHPDSAEPVWPFPKATT